MAITTLAAVKTAAELYNRTQSGAPTTSTSGVVGDMLMDTATGKTYELTSVSTVSVYNWGASPIVEGYDLTGDGPPTTSTVGVLENIYYDSTNDAYYILNSIITGPSYNWTEQTAIDTKINAKLTRVEQDYLAIRGLPFDKDSLDATVYPTGSSDTAAEMVCYLLELGRYQGRGNTDETEDKIQKTYDKKLHGYPMSIVGCIERFQRVQ